MRQRQALMPEEQVHVLIVEDEPIISLDLSTGLEQAGYRVVGVAEDAASAIRLFKTGEVDIVLMDINLKGEKDGIDTALELVKIRPVPLIYLTAFTDAATVERVKQTYPAAFLSKPYTMANVQIAIELALHNLTSDATTRGGSDAATAARDGSAAGDGSQAADVTRATDVTGKTGTPGVTGTPGDESEKGAGPDREVVFQWNDHLFVKTNYRFVRIALLSILYLSAENNYIHLVTKDKKYLLRLSLQQFLEKIAYEKLVRVHRSYVVNLDAIQSFTEQEVTVEKEVLPVGRQYKDAFLQRFGWR